MTTRRQFLGALSAVPGAANFMKLSSVNLALMTDAGATNTATSTDEIMGSERHSMFYKATQTHGQWDTWLYYDHGKYYLFYLTERRERSSAYLAIGQATSADGVHWSENGMILHAAAGVRALGTGSTWKSPRFERDKKFFLNFSEWQGTAEEGLQTIFFARETRGHRERSRSRT